MRLADASALLDFGDERRGTPDFVADEASLICALDIALREEEFTREESLLLVAAWLSGPRAAGALPAGQDHGNRQMGE